MPLRRDTLEARPTRPDGRPLTYADVGAVDEATFNNHHARHQNGGADALDVTTLAGFPGGTADFLRADHTFATPPDAIGLTQAQVLVRASLRG